MTQIVEADVLDPCRCQDLLVGVPEGVRVVHRTRLGRGKHIGVGRVLLMLLDQQIHRLLGDGHPAYRGFSLGPGEGQLAAGILDVLFAHRDCPVLDVQVIPEEGNQLAFPQAAHQLQVEHGQNSSCVGGIQVGFEVFRPEGLHFHLLHLGGNAVIGGVARDEPFLHRPLKRAVEHQVDAAYRGAAQTGISMAAFRVYPAMLH